jgi:glycerophosphoryl diester phosphodiesterase
MNKTALVLLSGLLLAACGTQTERESQTDSPIAVQLDIQGHRGARGLYPENTLEAFAEALKLGVNTLELDLAVTADSQLVVSHEPYISAEICLYPDGSDIPADSAQELNIFQMTYKEAKAFDCGSKYVSKFPDQVKTSTYKPLLTNVIELAENHASENEVAPIKFNIELKSLAPYDNIYHPKPADFSNLVYRTVDQRIDWSRVTIQSFDFRILQYFREVYPDVKLALLIENELSWQANIDSLGFTPDIYSCYHVRLNEQLVDEIKKEGMQVIPWTVNEEQRMKQLIGWGVDGIITDYPNIALKLTNEE